MLCGIGGFCDWECREGVLQQLHNYSSNWNLSLDVANSSNLLKADFPIAIIRSDVVAVSK